MPSPETEQIQRELEDAFAVFKEANPAVAAAIEALNISYAEYLQMLAGLSSDLYTQSGNIFS